MNQYSIEKTEELSIYYEPNPIEKAEILLSEIKRVVGGELPSANPEAHYFVGPIASGKTYLGNTLGINLPLENRDDHRPKSPHYPEILEKHSEIAPRLTDSFAPQVRDAIVEYFALTGRSFRTEQTFQNDSVMKWLKLLKSQVRPKEFEFVSKFVGELEKYIKKLESTNYDAPLLSGGFKNDIIPKSFPKTVQQRSRDITEAQKYITHLKDLNKELELASPNKAPHTIVVHSVALPLVMSENRSILRFLGEYISDKLKGNPITARFEDLSNQRKIFGGIPDTLNASQSIVDKIIVYDYAHAVKGTFTPYTEPGQSAGDLFNKLASYAPKAAYKEQIRDAKQNIRLASVHCPNHAAKEAAHHVFKELRRTKPGIINTIKQNLKRLISKKEVTDFGDSGQDRVPQNRDYFTLPARTSDGTRVSLKIFPMGKKSTPNEGNTVETKKAAGTNAINRKYKKSTLEKHGKMR